MSQLRSTIPAVLSVGLGYYGYHKVYKVKNSEPILVDEGISVQPWKVFVYSHLPFNTISRLWGSVNETNLPQWARQPVFRFYSWMFRCNLSEMEVNDVTQFHNLGEFFRRKLKSDLRPVDTNCLLTCPSDGRMLHCGKISGDQVEQVKGITYSLSQFFGPIDWNTSDSDREVGHYSDHIKYCHHNTDLYHAVIYLSPGDCHQFHSPTEWTIFFRRHFPGKLLSVNPYVARRVPDIFCLNERVAYIGQWKHGFMSLIAVGATNVGSIQIYHDKTLRTNSNKFYPRGTYIDRSYDNTCGQISPTSFIRGDSFGEFHLGSTIVLIFEAPKNFQFLLKPGQKVKCGQQLGV